MRTPSTSGGYRERYAAYLKHYVDNLPDPPDPMAGQPAVAQGNNSNAQKTALTRSVRYNDEKSRQSVTATAKK